MKTTFFLTLVSAALLTFAGCGDADEAPPNATTPSSNPPTTLSDTTAIDSPEFNLAGRDGMAENAFYSEDAC
ncbi:hypothetical protein [Allorhodopirellula solitaria]|uniref:Uncharacterized protein n=1 Tax=Allorhodopirellula solitaria TaxID=2527987 RepID=A0A5C5WYM4_9BACT|nr:hypothetical protein [Allorhodopirellula solitaria]TWT56064.1 hypothetical protein CA85_45370 [Allorhodopirellula solitaria]